MFDFCKDFSYGGFVEMLNKREIGLTISQVQ